MLQLLRKASNVAHTRHTFKQTMFQQGKTVLSSLVAFLLAFCLALLPGCALWGGSGASGAGGSEASVAGGSAAAAGAGAASAADVSVSEDGTYTDKDRVALYLHLYQKLPANYISKTKAKKAGWDAEKGNLWDVCPGKSIGGGTFYNDDGLLPEKSGRTWKECDIDYAGGYRGAKRICYSSDGLIFYTDDHYQSFTQLY